MVSYTLNGCAPEFALWSFVDLGYLSYYATYMIATGQIEGVAGETFKAGRMGYYTIEFGYVQKRLAEEILGLSLKNITEPTRRTPI